MTPRPADDVKKDLDTIHPEMIAAIVKSYDDDIDNLYADAIDGRLFGAPHLAVNGQIFDKWLETKRSTWPRDKLKTPMRGTVAKLRPIFSLTKVAVGTTFAAIITRMIRSSMLEVLKTEYMQVARSKGLLEPRLIFVHAFPNALIPVVTVMGIALALLMAGTVVVENVFAIKGLGRVLIQGILNRDYPVVQGAILVVSAIFVFSNLLVDLLYTVIDPRIRYE